jgi:hypothetical protein
MLFIQGDFEMAKIVKAPKRYGLFVGINYINTSSELAGCINDAQDLYERLSPHFDEILVLTEDQATKARIMDEKARFVGKLQYKDRFWDTYSGHGTWVPDRNNDEPDKRDEALCPIDFQDNLILDDEIFEVYSKRKRGSKIVMLTDSCHSGSVFRLYGMPEWGRAIKFIAPEQILSARTAGVAEKLEEKFLARETIKQHQEASSGIIHFSGCQDIEYSYDANFNGRANGAFTYYFLAALAKLGFEASCREIHEAMKEFLPSHQYPQRPKLNATSADKKQSII